MSTSISSKGVYMATPRTGKARVSLLNSYWNYIDRQESQKVYWFLVAIIVIPCVYMTISIMAMHFILPHIELYIGATMIVFFGNVMVHIAECKSRVFMPLFHLTTAFFILAPCAAYLIYG